ncbi:hypothetical protein [Streptacidiphilus sp. P02-A3a]|nr:hypothetical protein [Streptacidiphilus sp. P02-A3a]QMU73217.1 hypothetical protein GXP74_38285 [Streptacidiphilus sp. P02-A3a]
MTTRIAKTSRATKTPVIAVVLTRLTGHPPMPTHRIRQRQRQTPQDRPVQ